VETRSEIGNHYIVGQWQRHTCHLALSSYRQRYRNGSIEKKENFISQVNEEYFQTRSSGKIRVEMDEMWSFYHDKEHQIWLWWAMDHDTGEVVAFWFGSREHSNLDKLLELLEPLNIEKVYTDGNYAYYERVHSEVLVVSKKNTQKIERKHLSLRTWCSRLVRKGIRFSKTEQMHKICVGLTINYWFFGYDHLIQ
jgi:insertion element IS1 protein InsB